MFTRGRRMAVVAAIGLTLVAPLALASSVTASPKQTAVLTGSKVVRDDVHHDVSRKAHDVVAVYKVKVGSFTQPVEQHVACDRFEIIPSHVRNNFADGGIERLHIGSDNAQPFVTAIFITRFRQKLHA